MNPSQGIVQGKDPATTHVVCRDKESSGQKAAHRGGEQDLPLSAGVTPRFKEQ